MKRYIHITALLYCLTSYGQMSEIDSLKNELQGSHPDTTLVLIHMRIGFLHYQTSADSLLKYTNLGRELAEKVDFAKGIANAYNNLGTLEYARSNLDEALRYYEEFLEASEKADYLDGVNRALNNIGIILRIKGNFTKAIDSYERSLAVKDVLGDVEGKGGTYNNMGMVYEDLGNYTKALECYFKSIEIKEVIGKEDAFASTYSNLGKLYQESGKHELALDYYERSFDLYEKHNEKLGLGTSARNIGSVYLAMGQDEKAMEHLNLALEISGEIGNKMLLANAKNDIGTVYIREGKYPKALDSFSQAYKLFEEVGYTVGIIENLIAVADYYLRFDQLNEAISHAGEALEVSRLLEYKEGISDASSILHNAYAVLEDYPKAYEFSLLNKLYYDSLNLEQQSREIAIFESRYQLEKVSTENEILANQNKLNEATIERNRLQIQRQNIFIFGGLFVLLLSLILAYVGFRYYRSKKRSIELLERKNQEILLQSKVLVEQADELIRVNEEIKDINESLEEKVKRRTAEIQTQNEKLRDYAFSNAHHVRAPLARILGITKELRSEKNLSQEQKKQLNESLLSSAEELDLVIRKVNAILSEEVDGNA